MESGLVGRKRLGIVVTERHEGIFLRCMQGIIEGLNQDLFEVVIFCSPSGRGRLEKALGALGSVGARGGQAAQGLYSNFRHPSQRAGG
jgi:hypothetical protein